MPTRYLVAELPIGTDGLSGSRNQSQIPPTALINANNVSYAEGAITKEGGSAKYNSTAAATGGIIVGGHDWHPTTTNQRQIIAMDGGNVARSTGGATGVFTNIASGLTLNQKGVVFVEGGKELAANNRKLYMFSGSNGVKIVDGDASALSTLTDPASDWSSATNGPSFGLIHLDRLWAGGNSNDPHRLYYSTASNQGDIQTNGGTLAVYPGESQKIVAAVSFKGFIVTFKYPKGIYIVDTTDPSITNWQVQKLNDQIGLAGSHSWCVIDDDILFMDSAGNIQLISIITKESQGTRNVSQIADMGQWMRDNVNFAKLSNVRAVYHVAKREVHFAVAGIGSVVNNLRVVVDYNLPTRPRFRTSDKDIVESVWLKLDDDFVPRMTTGDNAGFVWNLDQDTKEKDGLGYEGLWQTPHMDLSHLDPSLATVRKNGHWLELVVEPKGNYDMNATIVWDGVEHETVTFNMGSTGAALGSFVLNTDTLGGGEVLNKKRQIHGSGRRISLIGKNSAASQDFSIARMYLHFTPGSDRL
jgi:hypothetical protein